MGALTDTAMQYQDRGWRAVILKPGLAEPLESGWQLAYDPRERSYFEAHEASGANLGVNAGASCLVVVDVDAAKGGVSSMHEAIKRGLLELPETYAVGTPGGGYHFYYEVPGGFDESVALKPGVNVLGREGLPGIDIRAGKSQVAAPPSTRTDKGYGGRGYRVVRDLPVSKAPATVMGLARGLRASSAVEPGGDGVVWAKAIAEAPSVPDGSQHGELLRVAGSLKASGVARRQALPLLGEIAKAFTVYDRSRPWGPDDVLAMWESIPGPELTTLSLDPEVTEWLTGRHLEEVAAAEAAASFGLDWSDDDLWDPKPVDWVVEGFMAAGHTVTIYSAGGAGKSLLAQDVAYGLAARGTVFGKSVTKRRVLYVDLENGRRTVLKRLKDMGAKQGDDLSALSYSSLDDWPPLDTEAGRAALLSRVAETRSEVVVLDTLSKTVEGDENSNDTWKNLHRALVPLRAAGVTVLQLDHTGKDSDRGQRGGSAKHDNADAVWHLSWEDPMVRLAKKKDRDDIHPDALVLERVAFGAGSWLHHRVPTSGAPALAAAAAHVSARAEETEARVAELVAALDDLGVPVQAGAPTCKKALNESSVTWRSADVAEAVRQRKSRSDTALN